MGTPCEHVYAAHRTTRQHPHATLDRFVARGLMRSDLLAAMGHGLEVVPIDVSQLRRDALVKNAPVADGEPLANGQKRRRKSKGETRVQKCSECGKEGHNKRSGNCPKKRAL